MDVDGSWVAVDVYGDQDRPAIMIIPGVMADAAAWGGVARRLTRWPTVAVVNRRGRRPSGPLTDSYSLATEVRDAAAVAATLTDVRTLFGWSYGALIALHLADLLDVAHLIAYEPVMAPFGSRALPDLQRAHDSGDIDASVDVALQQVAGMDSEDVGALRSTPKAWDALRRFSVPIYAETRAINEALDTDDLAVRTDRVDLVVGELNRGRAPYGTSFDDVASRVPGATVHELSGQAHLAHLEAPEELAALIDQIDLDAR